ncbi:MAG: hypothetical protein HY216_06155 [Candidatus Rokubacteria bacterium]|nr:hypothetical protein [Candidatus Rokubacteria bacterium]
MLSTHGRGGDQMKRFMLGSALVLTAFATPALAFQCPKLVAEISTNADARFDDAAYQARVKGAAAAKLHSEGKHAESVKVATEALASLGIKK